MATTSTVVGPADAESGPRVGTFGCNCGGGARLLRRGRRQLSRPEAWGGAGLAPRRPSRFGPAGADVSELLSVFKERLTIGELGRLPTLFNLPTLKRILAVRNFTSPILDSRRACGVDADALRRPDSQRCGRRDLSGGDLSRWLT